MGLVPGVVVEVTSLSKGHVVEDHGIPVGIVNVVDLLGKSAVLDGSGWV
jgi:hypothetical protein